MLAYVQTPTMVGASMVSVVNVEENIEEKTTQCVSLISKLAKEKELVEMTQQVEQAVARPKSMGIPLEQKSEVILEAPHF